MAKARRSPAKTKTSRTRDAAPPVPPLHATPEHPRGSLIIIGGNESKAGDRAILEQLARRAARRKLVVATFGTEDPEQQWQQYRKVFQELGVRRLEHLDARRREDLLDNPQLDVIEDAAVIFFGGGDQLKVTSRFGGTLLCDQIRELYRRGATIAGTSSGASVMSETMMVAGPADDSHEGNGSLRMAPGLGFIPGVVIDQHFAERGRMGRLLGAIAQNPRLLGIGIDEDTAVEFDGHATIRVLGSGAVYIVDGRGMTYTNATEESGGTSSMFGMAVHVLSRGDTFDLETREPRAEADGPGASGNANGR